MAGTIELISNDPSGRVAKPSWRWRCSCGASTGGRWYRSMEEAMKAAGRHTARCDDQPAESGDEYESPGVV